MSTNIPSYSDKEFVINDNLALIRNPNNLKQFSRYKNGDVIPPNSRIGERKLIPLRTKIRVRDIKTDAQNNVYVFAVPIDTPNFIPSGWTRSSNLAGGFLNEIVSYVPKEWDLRPMGDNFTIIDKNALIRKGPTDFESIGELVPYGSYVEVTARSRQTDPDGKYVRIRYIEIENGILTPGKPIGWTHFSNLVAGNSEVFKSRQWLNIKGDNAAWRSGNFIGAKVLIAIVGTGGQLQKIAMETFEPYLRLMEAAKKNNLTISITSGFRTFGKQERLYEGWRNGEAGFNLAAKPGRSNHQNGIAFDLNTIGFDGTKLYDWLKNNAPRFGFIRTVNKEHWHWEYLPDMANKLRAEGKFKLDRVTR